MLASIVFVSVITLTQVVSYQQYSLSEGAQRENELEEANRVADKLKSVLSSGLAATKTLAFVVEKYGVPADFDTIARSILESTPYIDAVQLTRKGVITHTYPEQGNEKALGFDVLSDPRTRDEARKALEGNRMFFAGPFELRQGGLAVVGRLPIFRHGEFFGFSVVIIRFESLLRATGLSEGNSEFAYQLSKVNPETAKEQFFLASSVPPEHHHMSIRVPDGEWKLYVFHRSNVVNWSPLNPLGILGFLLALIASAYSFSLARQPEKLKRRIKEATHAIEHANRLYQFTSEINAMAVHATDERSMYQRACDVAVGTGTYKMAWIGLIDNKNETLTYAARAGAGSDYVDHVVPLSLTGRNEHDAPVIRMLKTGKYVYCNDISKDSLMTQWQQRALEQGFRALIVLPISKFGQIIGSLNLYAGETDPFDENEVKLLEEVAATISFVIGNLERERQRTQAETLVQTEKVLSDSIINSMPGVFYLYNRQGRFLRWNKNFETVSGFSGEEIAQMHPLDFFEGDHRRLLEHKINNVFEKGKDEVLAAFTTKDGQQIPYYFNGKKVTFGGEDFLLGMGLDITESVESEAKLRERNEEIEKLSTHLQKVREEERARIALEIHDVLGQQLTAIKMDATWVKKKIQQQEVLDRICTMIGVVDDTIKSVRRISSELRPGILDDLGLIAALEWQGAEFQKNTGIKVQFRSNVVELDLPEEAATHIFRIYQEALTNVARHAAATEVQCLLMQGEENVTLTIRDNGRGIDLNAVRTKKSIGLISMKERARTFNGKVEVANNVSGGTIVSLIFKYRKNTVTI